MKTKKNLTSGILLGISVIVFDGKLKVTCIN